MAVRQFTTWQKLFKQKQQLLVCLFTSDEIRNEEWRDAVGYEGIYSISSLGRVRGDSSNGHYPIGRFLKPERARGGYARVVLCTQRKKKHFPVHALVAAAFIGVCPEKNVVNHKDGIKLNNRPSNLEYCTQKQNVRHAIETGLRVAVRGERHWIAKVSDNEIPEIFELKAHGLFMTEIGIVYGISGSQVANILRGRSRRAALSFNPNWLKFVSS